MSPARQVFEEGAAEGYTAEDVPALVELVRELYKRLEGPVTEPMHERDPDVLSVLS